jgi:hypothetical protein
MARHYNWHGTAGIAAGVQAAGSVHAAVGVLTMLSVGLPMAVFFEGTARAVRSGEPAAGDSLLQAVVRDLV